MVDLLAALALVAVIEGLALVVFAKSLPTLMSEIDQISPGVLRRVGGVMVAGGACAYLLVRGA